MQKQLLSTPLLQIRIQSYCPTLMQTQLYSRALWATSTRLETEYCWPFMASYVGAALIQCPVTINSQRSNRRLCVSWRRGAWNVETNSQMINTLRVLGGRSGLCCIHKPQKQSRIQWHIQGGQIIRAKKTIKSKGLWDQKINRIQFLPYTLSIWWNMVIIWLRNPLISIFPRNWSYPYFPRLDCTESLRATSDMHRLDALAQGGGLSRSIILA